MAEIRRCGWAHKPADQKYHDEEWGVPVHDDRVLFEFLILEGAQAGLSWSTILAKRENYRKAFAGFDPRKVAKFDDARLAKLMENPGIVRNRLKIQSTVTNAKAFLQVQKDFGSFDKFLWNFVGGKPIVSAFKDLRSYPTRTPLSDAISKELLRRGFKFVGTTIIYAYMQAVGIVNDHQADCAFREADSRAAKGGDSSLPDR